MFELIVVVVLVLLNGVFSGAEIALLSVRKTRVQELVAEGRAGARWIVDLRAHPERLLATVQIGITVVGSTAAAFGGSAIAERVAVPLQPVLGDRADEVAFALVVAFVSYLSLVLGELVPKSLALRAAEPYALLVAPVLAGVAWIARPLVWFLTASSNVVLRVFGDRTSFVESRLSQEELRQLMDEAATAGTVDEDAGEIASRALGFSELTVSDVLVPRPKIVSVGSTTTVDELARLTLTLGHSRVLVHGADPDDVLGYVSVRDVLARARAEGAESLAEQLHPVLFVPTSMSATGLLRELQSQRTHLAVAVDEQGTVRGLVTLEDLVEELVGDILSERERPSDDLLNEGEDRWLVLASAPLRDVERTTGFELPEAEDAATLGGLVLEAAGRIPSVGDRVELGGLSVEIVEGIRRKLKKVRLTRRPT